MLSPLQLKAHRFTLLHLEGLPQGLPEGNLEVSTSVSLGKHQTDSKQWKVELKVTFGPNKDQSGPYRGVAEVVGLFEVLDGWPEEQCEKLVAINGTSLLYGAVREMILAMSSRSSHGELLLPTLLFQSLEEPPAAETAPPTKKAKKRGAKKSK